MFTTVAIVGSAGRNADGHKMNAKIFSWMVNEAKRVVAQWQLLPSNIILVSGGSAWADHVAVQLFLDGFRENNVPYAGLEVYMPTDLIDNLTVLQPGASPVQYRTTGPGKILNQLHNEFTYKMGYDTLKEIWTAKSHGANLHASANGFHARNTQVATSDYLLAFTWASAAIPKPGGTLDTWNKCKGHKLHVVLQND